MEPKKIRCESEARTFRVDDEDQHYVEVEALFDRVDGQHKAMVVRLSDPYSTRNQEDIPDDTVVDRIVLDTLPEITDLIDLLTAAREWLVKKDQKDTEKADKKLKDKKVPKAVPPPPDAPKAQPAPQAGPMTETKPSAASRAAFGFAPRTPES